MGSYAKSKPAQLLDCVSETGWVQAIHLLMVPNSIFMMLGFATIICRSVTLLLPTIAPVDEEPKPSPAVSNALLVK